MKSRLGALVALSLLSSLLVALTQTPAQAANFGARLTRTALIAGEYTKVYGAVAPARRLVQLQTVHSGRWIGVRSMLSAANGAYAFTVRATSASVQYRVYAPMQKKNKKKKIKKAPASYSNVVRVRGVQASLSLGFVAAPVGKAPTGNAAVGSLLTPGVAAFRPARPGVAVTLQRWVNGAWTRVGTANQDASGNARFNLVVGSYAYRAVSAASGGVAPKVTSAVRPTQFPNSYDENFSDPYVSDQGWATRVQEPQGRRQCAQTDDTLKSYAGGVATIRAVKQPTNPKGTSACPYGFWHNGMIGTGRAAMPYTPTYGIYAARVKFQSVLGSHGSFWMQAMDANGAEIDVAEYFGDGRPDGGLSSFVHAAATGSTATSSGGILASAKTILGKGSTPSNGWHVYSVQWSPAGYTFRIDGVPSFSTNKPLVSSSPSELVLSLLTSDYELRYMKGSSATMLVDWVRGWK
jgi:hypothetical protein